MSAGAWLCLAALALAAPGVRSEPVYVIEQLVVNLTDAPGGQGNRIATVKSGEQLELLDRQHDEAHVRLANGTEGWLRASYLSSEEPLQHRLSERTAEVEKLKQDLTRLESELAAARVAGTAAPGPTVRSAADPDATAAPGDAGAHPPPHDAELFMRTPEQHTWPRWAWVLGSSTVMLIVGFALGWRALDRRIRRKYGGLRIY